MRVVLDKRQVLEATKWSNSTLWLKIKEGKFPAPVKLDPDARRVVWLDEDVTAWQDRGIEASRSVTA